MAISAEESARSARFIVEFNKQLSAEKIQQLIKANSDIIKISSFDNIKSDYFSRLYNVDLKISNGPQNNIRTIRNISGVVNVEEVFEFEPFSIIPNRSSDIHYSNDPLTIYQWGLFNHGQIIQYDVDDIHYEQVAGDEKTDIGVKKIFSTMGKNSDKKIVVAILDSGIDIDHSDIKNNILKNDIECENGKLPFNPLADNDQNGYSGDCMGWNFTSKKEGGDNLVYDDDGHGTHLAGIIAAEANNNLGITSIAKNIKVLPVKVLYKKDQNNKATLALSDRLAKGILYAIKMKADIINLSLGWPKSLETKYLNESINLALSSGIIIVAAAGNNNSSEPVYPCALDGVACVGSISNDGKISRFSNYGGSVDLLAPGDNILSTYPEKLNPLAFSVEGYEIKSGTSQAAPFISAMLGVLKASLEDATNSELFARLALSSSPAASGKKFSIDGLPNLEQALTLSAQPMVRPILKHAQYINYSKANGNFSFTLPIKNYWAIEKNIVVSIKLNSPHLILSKSNFNIDSLSSGEVTTLEVNGQITNTSISNKVAAEITISSSSNNKRTYYNHLTITRTLDLAADHDLVTFQLPISAKKSEFLSTITNKFSNTTSPEYYLEEYSPEGMEIAIFRLQNDSYAKLAPSISIPNAKKLISILKVDINYDGNDDYFVGSLVKTEKEQYLLYSFYNNNLSPLFSEKLSHWKFTPETVFIDLKTLWFIPFTTAQLGKVALPAFLAKGKVPLLDKNPNSFLVDARNNIPHIYYLAPEIDNGSVVLKTRIFDNYKFIKMATRELDTDWDEELYLHYVLPQSRSDYQAGILRAIFSSGENLAQNFYIVPINTSSKYKFELLDSSLGDLANNYVYPTINITRSSIDLTGLTVFIGFQRDDIATHLALDLANSSLNFPFQQVQSYRRDHLVGFLASFRKENIYHSFWQSRDELIYHSLNSNGKEHTSSVPINRFSFLPGNIFQELYSPVTVNILGETRPALYIDSTQINSKHIYITTIDENQDLVSPAKFNLEIPSQCIAKNPVMWGARNDYAYALLCKDQEQIRLILLPLKIDND